MSRNLILLGVAIVAALLLIGSRIGSHSALMP